LIKKPKKALKALLCKTFKAFFGSGLSAKRCLFNFMNKPTIACGGKLQEIEWGHIL
jgi:hypothetical protein